MTDKILKSAYRYLTTALERISGYRKRFFDIYKRDIKYLKENNLTKTIWNSNAAIYDGDIVVDVFLFEYDKKTDRTTFRELYDLDAD